MEKCVTSPYKKCSNILFKAYNFYFFNKYMVKKQENKEKPGFVYTKPGL